MTAEHDHKVAIFRVKARDILARRVNDTDAVAMFSQH